MKKEQKVGAKVKAAITSALSGTGFTVKTVGTRTKDDRWDINAETGFWEGSTASKPPRVVIHIDISSGRPRVSFAKKADGSLISSAATLGGAFNTKDGTDVAFFCQLMPVVKTNSGKFEKVNSWRWYLVLVLDKPLPKGSAAEILSDFDPEKHTFEYQGKTFKAAKAALVTSKPDNARVNIDGVDVTYDDLTEQLADFLHLRGEVETTAQPEEEVSE